MTDRPLPLTSINLSTTSGRRRRRQRLGAVASAAAATVATSLAVFTLNSGGPSTATTTAFTSPPPIHPSTPTPCGTRLAATSTSSGQAARRYDSRDRRAATAARRRGGSGDEQSELFSPVGAGVAVGRHRDRRVTIMSYSEGGDEQIISSAGVNTLDDVGKMKLPELKALFRERGGKPGTLRKSELVRRITSFLAGAHGAGDDVRSSQEERAGLTSHTVPSQGSLAEAITSLETGTLVLDETMATAIPASVEDMTHGRENAGSSSAGHDVRYCDATAEPLNSLTHLRAASASDAGQALEAALGETKVKWPGTTAAGAFCSASTPAAEATTTTSTEALSPDDHLHRVTTQLLQEPGVFTSQSSQRREAELHVEEETVGSPTSGAAQTTASSRLQQGTLNGGAAAVVAAARARGAAAAAASARVAATGRVAALTAAKRHAEAVRARVSTTWQLSSGAQQSRHFLLPNEVLSAEGVGDPEAMDEEENGTRSRTAAGAWSRHLVGASLIDATVAEGRGRLDRLRDRGAGSAYNSRMSGGCNSGGAVGGRDHDAVSGVHVDDRGKPFSTGRVNACGGGARVTHAHRSTERSMSAAPPDIQAGEQGGGHYDGEAAQPAERISSGGRGHRAGGASSLAGGTAGSGGAGGRGRSGGKPRHMPKIHNPWAQAGNPAVEEWISGNGDVVEEFLMHTMGRLDDKDDSSNDPIFNRENRFNALPGSPMSLHFLGTASCIPSTSRGVSCTVLRMQGDLWMFDVGEGTQIQIQKSSMKPTKVTKIFVTHAHGDHSFGLPGMLCLMGQNYERGQGKRVEIYGPTGLRAYLRAAMRYTYSRVAVPYVVHELKEVPYLHSDYVPEPEEFYLHLGQDPRYGEQRGGRDIYPNEKGQFEIINDDKAIVRATAMKHGVPCVGFCIEEPTRPGRLKVEDIDPIVQEHKHAIMKASGTSTVGWVLGALKALKPGESLTLPGTDVTIDHDRAMEPQSRGRKVVILGDTCDAGSMVPLAQDADVVVHEATNTLLYPVDQGKSYATVESEAIDHGHSTPLMAAAFARQVNANMLVLTHFSPRYRGDANIASVAAMMRIERQAARVSGLERHQVVASWDLLDLPILSQDSAEAHKDKARAEDSSHAAALRARATAWQRRTLLEGGGGARDTGGEGWVPRSEDGMVLAGSEPEMRSEDSAPGDPTAVGAAQLENDARSTSSLQQTPIAAIRGEGEEFSAVKSRTRTTAQTLSTELKERGSLDGEGGAGGWGGARRGGQEGHGSIGRDRVALVMSAAAKR